MKKLLAVLIACLALTIAACGGDDDDDGGDTGGATTTEQTETTAPAESDAVTVDIPEISFEPADATVKVGGTVSWTNSDDIQHTVTKVGGPGAQFDSGNLDPGDEFEQTFDKKGLIKYVCTIHAGQEGTVTVE
jgi:plastocyanin